MTTFSGPKPKHRGSIGYLEFQETMEDILISRHRVNPPRNAASRCDGDHVNSAIVLSLVAACERYDRRPRPRALYLLEAARKDCEREGIVPTSEDLHQRVARRLGRRPDGVPRDIDRTTAIPRGASLSAATCAKILAMMNEVLGSREYVVFRARVLCQSCPRSSYGCLATRLGVTIPRIQEIEISARQKIATAMILGPDRSWSFFL